MRTDTEKTDLSNLDGIKLTPEQMMRLLKLAVSFTPIMRHDLNGDAANIIFALGVIDDRIKELTECDENHLGQKENLSLIKRVVDLASRSMNSILGTLDTLRIYSVEDEFHENVFFTRPSLVQKVLKKKFPRLKIESELPDDFKFVFPEYLFNGIVAELVRNAVKHGSSKKILIKWRVQGGNSFECEVHDSGRGFPNLVEHFQPGFSLVSSDKWSGHGLKLLHNVISMANGILLFKRSPILGGSMAYLQLPIIKVTKNER
jgi:signal transduction histidine kinase